MKKGGYSYTKKLQKNRVIDMHAELKKKGGYSGRSSVLHRL